MPQPASWQVLAASFALGNNDLPTSCQQSQSSAHSKPLSTLLTYPLSHLHSLISSLSHLHSLFSLTSSLSHLHTLSHLHPLSHLISHISTLSSLSLLLTYFFSLFSLTSHIFTWRFSYSYLQLNSHSYHLQTLMSHFTLTYPLLILSQIILLSAIIFFKCKRLVYEIFRS